MNKLQGPYRLDIFSSTKVFWFKTTETKTSNLYCFYLRETPADFFIIYFLFFILAIDRPGGWSSFIYLFFLVKFTLAAFSLNCRTLLMLIFMRSKSSQKITHKLRTPYTVDPTFDQSNQNTR